MKSLIVDPDSKLDATSFDERGKLWHLSQWLNFEEVKFLGGPQSSAQATCGNCFLLFSMNLEGFWAGSNLPPK